MLIQTENEYTDRVKETYVFSNLDTPKNRNFEIGYTIGFGIKTGLYKKLKIFIESRYEVGSGVSENLNFGATSKYYSFVCGIEF